MLTMAFRYSSIFPDFYFYLHLSDRSKVQNAFLQALCRCLSNRVVLHERPISNLILYRPKECRHRHKTYVYLAARNEISAHIFQRDGAQHKKPAVHFFAYNYLAPPPQPPRTTAIPKPLTTTASAGTVNLPMPPNTRRLSPTSSAKHMEISA